MRAQWPTVAAQIGDERTGSPAHLPRTEPPRAGKEAARRNGPVAPRDRSLKSLAGRAGLPVLDTGGGHIDRVASGYVQFPGRRWLRFPVRRRPNAVMTAVDQAGRRVARYRILDWGAIEITVHPDQQLTDELIHTLALTARWVSSFFGSSGGGG